MSVETIDFYVKRLFFRDDVNNFKDLDAMKCQSGGVKLDVADTYVIDLVGKDHKLLTCPINYVLTGKIYLKIIN